MSTHRLLTGTDLHENKGVSSAADNTVATADSAATVWQKLTASHLTGTGNPFGGQLLQLTQQKTINVDGGTLTAGAWTARIWTNRLVNQITGVTWSNEDVTLPAGTYRVEAWATGYNCGNHQTRLRTTTGTLLVTGLSSRTTSAAAATAAIQTPAMLTGNFVLATSKTVNLEHNCQTTVTGNGQGNGSGLGTEVYAVMNIWKVL